LKAREKAFAFGLILCALLLAYSYAYLDAILAVLSETVLGAVGVGGPGVGCRFRWHLHGR